MSEPVPVLTDTDALAAFCEEARAEAYVTVDTEFIRDKTYWPKLCLVQVATARAAVCIDPLSEGIDLAPLHALLDDASVLKVFHAARQDLEIFYHATGRVPAPIFDTQVAAMVCGFGDQVGYEALIAKTVGARIDKTSRFTDWSRRPLSERQLAYALADVTHLRGAYDYLAARLETTGRAHWLAEEMAVLADPATYELDPQDAWKRIKTRGGNPRFKAIVRALAVWREREAQTRDVPRNRVMKDDVLMDVAANAPGDAQALDALRSVPRGFAASRAGQGVLAAVAEAQAIPKDRLPKSDGRAPPPPAHVGPVTDLLKVLLKRNCEVENVASRLVASGDDLEAIALDDNADVPALKGWRRALFGEDALALKRGELALVVENGRVEVVALEDDPGPGAA